MAISDYHLCAICEGKAFYDANISDPRYVATYDPSENTAPIDIKALCPECAETYEVVVKLKDLSTNS